MDMDEDWDIVIEPKAKTIDFKLAELGRYKDLIYMFIKRDFVSIYKQTILGPLWFFIQPLITTATYMVVFGQIAHLSTNNAPPVLFYLSGILFWNFFSTSFLKTADTFTANAGIFGKVYFPRLTVPIANVCTAFISFSIQFFLFASIYLLVVIFNGYKPHIGFSVLLLPVLILIIALFALGTGIIVSALTTKYRDLKFLISFGMQLLMYAAPVVYPISSIQDARLMLLLKLNPITHIIEAFRYSVLGSGSFSSLGLCYSAGMTIIVLMIGIIVFNKIEKGFMDTI